MRKPTIHLNGTSATALSDGYAAAATALNLAITALGDCAPNARDYYPQGEGAFDAAAREHKARVEALATVHAQLVELFLHVEDVGQT